MHSVASEQDGAWAAARAVAPFGRPYRAHLAGAIAFLVFAAAGQTAGILIFGRITDTVLATGRLSALWEYASAWGAVAVLGAGLSFAGGCLTTWVGEHVVLALRDHTFTRVRALPPDVRASYRDGDLLARLTSDIDAVEQLAASGLVQAGAGAASALLFAVAAFWVRWDLALAVCALAPLFWWTSRRLSTLMTSATRDERAGNADLTTVVAEALAADTRDGAVRIHDAGARWLRAGLRQARLSQAYPAIWQLIETGSVLAVLAMGAWEISAHRLTLGGLLAFAGFLGYLYPYLQELGGLAVEAASAAVATHRLRVLWTDQNVEKPADDAA